MNPLRVFSKLRDQSGVSVILVAIVMAMLIGFAALAVDIGYVATTKNELQNIADGGALAGAGQLGAIYKSMPPAQQSTYVCDDPTPIKNVVKDVAAKNPAGGMYGITINDAEIIIGRWDGSNFTPTADQPDAVKVIARRDGNANGPIATFFARIFGIDTADVAADAIAALSGPAIMDEGEMKLPIGLSEHQFPNDCNEVIHLSPTTDSCAGWHNFFDPINASAMKDKLLGLIAAHTSLEGCTLQPCGQDWLDHFFDMNKDPEGAITPVTSAYDEYEFQGGTIASLFLGANIIFDDDTQEMGGHTIDGNPNNPAPFPALFNYFRRRDGDLDDSIWTTTVPVYKDGITSCENPNDALEIAGFAVIEVKMPNPPPDSTVDVYVYCELFVVEGRGGGGTYGNLKGTIPNLVE